MLTLYIGILIFVALMWALYRDRDIRVNTTITALLVSTISGLVLTLLISSIAGSAAPLTPITEKQYEIVPIEGYCAFEDRHGNYNVFYDNDGYEHIACGERHTEFVADAEASTLTIYINDFAHPVTRKLLFNMTPMTYRISCDLGRVKPYVKTITPLSE